MSAANEPKVMNCPRCGDGQTSLALEDAISRTRLQQPFPHFPRHAPRWISNIFSVAPQQQLHLGKVPAHPVPAPGCTSAEDLSISAPAEDALCPIVV